MDLNQTSVAVATAAKPAVILNSPVTREIVAGTVGGWAQVAVGYPFDTIKVRLQTQPDPPKYHGAIDCLKKIVREEGFRGLYKGATSPLMGSGLCNAVLFSTNGFFRRMLQNGDNAQALTLKQTGIAGACTGVVMSFFSCPQELLKVTLQTQNQKPSIQGLGNAVMERPQYKGVIDAGIQIFQKRGIRGMYRGYTITLLRDTPSFATYFVVYEGIKSLFSAKNPGGKLKSSELLIAGGAAGAACWIPCYPQDVIKSRMQSNLKYRSTFQCFRMLVSQARKSNSSTIRALFKGFAPTMARAVPANAATFFAYETALQMMRVKDEL